MDRRGLLRAVGTGLAVAGAGCSSVTGMVGPPPYLEEVRVQNYDVIAHEVRVTVEQRGERVHETEFELGEKEAREYGGPYRPSKETDCAWSGRGPFEVTCTVDGDRTATTRVDGSDSTVEGEYATVGFRIRSTGAVRPEPVWMDDRSGDKRCDGPTPTV